MTYDSSISTEVSLSKILDQMILDDTPIDIIVQFLESHESCVKDIFANSVFVYDLYDVATSCSFPDKRLEKYICCLPPILMFFVLTSCVELALELEKEAILQYLVAYFDEFLLVRVSQYLDLFEFVAVVVVEYWVACQLFLEL